MAKSVNRLLVSGNLGRDPEVRFAASGTAVCTVSVAVSGREKGKSGAWEDTTTWIDLVAFGKTAEILGEYGFKGCPVTADGSLRVRDYAAKDGSKGRAVELIVDAIAIHGRRDRAADTGRREPAGNGRTLDDREEYTGQF